MTYQLCKKLIESGKITGLIDKLDVFLLNNRMTDSEYSELVNMINRQEEANQHGKNV